jgi:hypothetical protein
MFYFAEQPNYISCFNISHAMKDQDDEFYIYKSTEQSWFT